MRIEIPIIAHFGPCFERFDGRCTMVKDAENKSIIHICRYQPASVIASFLSPQNETDVLLLRPI